MMRFSQRMGLTTATKLAQRESMDADLRASLWSVLTVFYWKEFSGRNDFPNRSQEVQGSNFEGFMGALWLYFFKKPIDDIERFWPHCLQYLREYYFRAKWYEVYDFLEFIAENGPDATEEEFVKACNWHLAQENSAYRFVNGRIAEITSQQEIDEVESAIQRGGTFTGVEAHLTAALRLMTSKTSPDYRNSIKESISAVESMAKKLVEDDSATLGVALKKLEATKKLHPALKNAFSSLYGYTSNADGIRHALLDESNLSKTDARFMLVCCSAFVNYLVDTLETS